MTISKQNPMILMKTPMIITVIIVLMNKPDNGFLTDGTKVPLTSIFEQLENSGVFFGGLNGSVSTGAES